jgi:esterase/lipase
MVKPGVTHWLVGLSLGTLCGVYLAQNYKVSSLSTISADYK